MNDKIDEKIEFLVQRLTGRFGRYPTEEEVLAFINGSQEERLAIWNKEKEE